MRVGRDLPAETIGLEPAREQVRVGVGRELV
jgi:hypothetical protein